MSYKTIPILDSDEFAELTALTQRTPEGCLLFSGVGVDKRTVYIRGLPYKVTRVMWAETNGDADMNDHEVVHIPECPHTGGSPDEHGHYFEPICIEPSHLYLAQPGEHNRAMRVRASAYRSHV